MFQSFRFEGQVIFENSTSIKSRPLKSVSLFYIDIRFPSFVNEGYSIDTQFCTHDLINENDWNDHPCTPKNHYCITFINSFIAYHKNDLEILTVTIICSISKSDHQIERYRIIKFAWSACVVSRQGRPHMINLN